MLCEPIDQRYFWNLKKSGVYDCDARRCSKPLLGAHDRLLNGFLSPVVPVLIDDVRNAGTPRSFSLTNDSLTGNSVGYSQAFLLSCQLEACMNSQINQPPLDSLDFLAGGS